MTEHPLDRLPHQGAGADVRVGYGGVARIVVLCILMAGGRRLIAEDLPSGLHVLPVFYAVGFVFSVFQVVRLRRTERMLGPLTKAQVGIDFAVVDDANAAELAAAKGWVPLTREEVTKLTDSNGGRPLDADMVRAIEETKRQFPGARIEAGTTLAKSKSTHSRRRTHV